jgi:hypothetical protein
VRRALRHRRARDPRLPPHNLHATWLVPSMSPAMADLDLEGFGLDLRGTDLWGV